MWPCSFIISVAGLIFFNFQFCRSESCPATQNVNMCNCYTASAGISVFCARIASLEELRTAIGVYRNHSIYSLAVQGSTFEFLPHDIFQGLTIKHLTISSSNFSRIGNLGEPQFEGLENSLETLKFEKTFSKQHPLPFLQMEHLTKLTTLEFRDSFLRVLHNRWLKGGPKSLRAVHFTNANIKAIGHHALNSLTNLRMIDLSENELNYIPRWAFPEPAVYLTEINLERNNLETLPDDFFTKMPNLAKVNLHLNELSTIGEVTWRAVWQNLEYINIDYNPMICDNKIKWILEEKILADKLVGTCYKPFNLMDRDIHSLKAEELKYR